MTNPSSAPIVSVIIPMYNVEDYLHECLDSAVGQTLQNIEILCIDDGSPDRSAEIAAEYAEKYSNVKLIRKENGGQSSARNVALDIARGRYVYFLDSDDYLEPNTLEALCARADEENLDIVYFNTIPFFENKEVKEQNLNFINYYKRKGDYSGVHTGQSMFAKMRKNGEFFGSPCLEIFRRSLIEDNNIRFYCGIIHEDNLFTFKCTMLAQRTGYIDQYFYHRRVHGDSTMTTSKSMRNVEGYLVCYSEMIDFMHEREVEPEAAPVISEYLYYSIYRNACNIYRSLGIQDGESFLNEGDFCADHFLDLVKKNIRYENDIDSLRRRIKTLEANAQKAAAAGMKNSILYVPRKILGGFKCVWDHGLIYTVKRAARKFWGVCKKLDKKYYRSGAYQALSYLPRQAVHFARYVRKNGVSSLLRVSSVKLRQKLGAGAPLVSIIMPVYNVEEYLEQNLDSLLNQTMKHIEILCVDDGSTDRSLEILNRYAAKDKRVQVFTQQNKFAGAARNLGLANAKGEYVVFLDSDDFFSVDLAKDAYFMAKLHEADIVLYGARHYNNMTGEYKEAKWLLNAFAAPQKQPFSYKDCPDNLYRITTPCPWTKMFRRQFVLDTGLQFQTLQNSNDLFFTYSSLAMAKRIVTLDKQLVNYRVGLANNLQSTKKKNPLCFYTAYLAWHDKLVELGVLDELRRSYVNLALSGCLYNLRSLKDLEAKRTVFDMLHNEIFDKLEILGHEASYYYKKADYEDMLLVAGGTFEQYLESQDIELPSRLAEVENIPQAPAVSIIIPCYNAEKYLDACMGSVLNQTLQNIEILCVDDGSTDHTLTILNRYAETDERVRVFTQQNKFAGAARNLGLANAKGEYVIFLDSDDFFEETLAEDAYSMADANNADVVLYNARYFDDAAGEFRDGWFLNTALIPEKQPFSYQDCPDDLFRITTPCPWTKLFRRQFLLDTGLQFQTLRHSNDIFFVLSALAMAKRIVTLDKQLVSYRVGHTTNLQSTKDKNPLYFYAAYQAWHDKLAELGMLEELRRGYVNRALSGCLYNLHSLKDPEAKKLVYDKLREEIFRKLEITGHDEAYYFAESDYNELLLILNGTYEQYLEFPETLRLKNVWNAVETGTRQVRSLPQGSQPRNAALSAAAERIISVTKRYTTDFSHPDAPRAYRMAHEAFNREEFADVDAQTFQNPALYQDFAAIQTYDDAARKDMASRRLIVSLTSYPGRIGTLTQVLDSLYAQTRKADEIVLWLAREQFPGKEADLPQELVQLANENRLTIRWCDDLKPHKKYFYAMQEYPEDIIVTVDDDLLYSRNMLSSLYASYLRYPYAVSAVRAHLMLVSPEKRLLPYNTWVRETDCCLHTPSMQLFATGGAGTLYPPHLFRKEFFDRDAILAHCPLADDLWLKAMELVSGVPVVVAREREPLKYVQDSQAGGLKYINDAQKQNDAQLANIIRWTDQVFGKDVLMDALTDTGTGHPILGLESVTYHLDQERRAIRQQLYTAKAAGTKAENALQQTQRRLTQTEERLKKAEAKAKDTQCTLSQTEAQLRKTEAELRAAQDKLRTTQDKLRRTEASKPIGRQLKELGKFLQDLKKKGHSPLSLCFKYLVYALAWIPEKLLAFMMYYLRNGFVQTVKKAFNRLRRRG